MSSIFTKIINREIPSYTIAENNMFYAFLDIFPVQKGHTLVVPKIEVDKIFDVPDEYLAQLLVFAKPIAKAIEQSFPCHRVSIVTVGLEVPHAHLHLIPIYKASDASLEHPKLKLSTQEFIAIQQTITQKL